MSRPAKTAQQPNSPSCGNQPAHIRLTTRRHRHARRHPAAHPDTEAVSTTTVVDTASPCPLDTQASISGPGSAPFDLRFTDPAGKRYTGAHLVQVSNNRCGRTLHTLASRPRLDSGRLGVITLELPEGSPDPALLAAISAGRPTVSPASSPGRRERSKW